MQLLKNTKPLCAVLLKNAEFDVHYYKRHLGDYAKKAGHLSPLEHGVYSLILDSYYDREQAPTLVEATRWARARTEEEKSAVLAVLDEFFKLDGERYVQKRVEEELAEYRSKAETNRLIAVAREEQKRARRANDSAKNVEPEEHDSCTTGQPNHKPLTINQEPRTNSTPLSSGDDVLSCPAGSIVNLYHEFMPENPRVKVLNDARKKAIRQRWLQAKDLDCAPFGYTTRADGLAAWQRFFQVCAQSAFLTGKGLSQAGRPPFVADIDFIFSPSGFAKILENKYHREAV